MKTISANFKKSEIVKILKFTYPVLLSMIVQLLFGIGDQAIIGRTSIEGFAAVGVVASFIYVLTGTIGIFGVVFNILGAKHLGKNDLQTYGDYFNLSMTLSIIIGVVFEIISIFCGKFILSSFFGLQGSTLTLAYDYLCIAGASLGINSMIFVCGSFLKNMQRTKTLPYISIMAGLINLAIDYTLVFGKFGAPQFGVKGAAIGTIAGLATSLIFYFLIILRHKKFKLKLEIKLRLLPIFLKKYFFLAGQDLLEYTLFALMINSIVAHLGTFSLATHSLLNSLLEILALPMFAFSSATLTYVALASGEGNIKKIKTYPKQCLSLSLTALFFIGGIYLCFPSFFFGIITSKKELIESASKYLLLMCIIQVFNITNHIYKNALLALDKEKWVLIYSIIGSLIGIISIYTLAIATDGELFGVYIGIGVYYLFATCGYVLYFNHGNPTVYEKP